jgi:hypothetical protein
MTPRQLPRINDVVHVPLVSFSALVVRRAHIDGERCRIGKLCARFSLLWHKMRHFDHVDFRRRTFRAFLNCVSQRFFLSVVNRAINDDDDTVLPRAVNVFCTGGKVLTSMQVNLTVMFAWSRLNVVVWCVQIDTLDDHHAAASRAPDARADRHRPPR